LAAAKSINQQLGYRVTAQWITYEEESGYRCIWPSGRHHPSTRKAKPRVSGNRVIVKSASSLFQMLLCSWPAERNPRLKHFQRWCSPKKINARSLHISAFHRLMSRDDGLCFERQATAIVEAL
jgi:hypothetical protein